MFQLTLIFGAVEVALRGGNEPVGSNLPKLKAADADPAPLASRASAGPEECPVKLRALSPQYYFVHDHRQVGERSHKGPRHFRNGTSTRRWNAVIDGE